MADWMTDTGRTITDNGGDNTTDSSATGITTGNSTKGSWTEIVASTACDTDYLILAVLHEDTGAEEFLIDIGVGSSGNEEMIAEDVYMPGRASHTLPNYYPMRIHIPSGTRVSVRAQGTTSRTIKVQMKLLSSSFMSSAGWSSAFSIGSDAATDVYGVTTDPGGTANTKGSWTEATSSTSDDINGFLLVVGYNDNATNNTASNWLIDVGIGAASSEEVIVENHWIKIGTSENANVVVFYDIFIPAGTRIAFRAQCSNTDASDRLITPDLIGFR